MQDDPIRLSDTRAWMNKAERDLKSAENGLKAVPPLLEDVVFHCQPTGGGKGPEGLLDLA